jgi:hypothetical protein
MLVKQEHRYKVLLISLIGFIFVSPLLPRGRVGDIVVGSLFLLVIFSAPIKLSTYTRWCLPLFAALSLFFGAFVHYGLAFALLNRVMTLLFFGTTIRALGRDIFNETHPRIDHLYGAIIIYFLIGIIYALAYQVFQLINPQELIIANTGLALTNPFDFFYFSFITLGTVGFGDVIAHGQFAKIISMLESMTGLFYLAMLVARLVGFFQSSRK